MKSQVGKLGDVVDDEGDLADRMTSQERNVTLVRSSSRRAFEGPLANTLPPIAELKTIGKLRHGRTERPVSYREDEAVARDCNPSTAASSRRTRARNSTTSS